MLKISWLWQNTEVSFSIENLLSEPVFLANKLTITHLLIFLKVNCMIFLNGVCFVIFSFCIILKYKKKKVSHKNNSIFSSRAIGFTCCRFIITFFSKAKTACVNTHLFQPPLCAHYGFAGIQEWAAWSGTTLHGEHPWHGYDCDLKVSKIQLKKCYLEWHHME